MGANVFIILSATWLVEELDNIDFILKEALTDFTEKGDRIINIEKHVGSSGLSRFWIYIEKTKEEKKTKQ